MRVAVLLLLIGCGAADRPDPEPTVDTPEPTQPGTTAPTGSEMPEDGDADGYVEDDCDDSDPTRHPGAPDAPYDGVDSDCRGNNDYDVDGDGSKAVAYGGTDCGDEDPAVHAGAPQVCGNGVDDDCDGKQDCLYDDVYVEDLAAGWYTVPAGAGIGHFDLGDTDGDGVLDLVAGSPRLATSYVFRGPLLDVGKAEGADASLLGGHSVTFGDFDGDGLDDVAATNSGIITPTVTTIWSGDALGDEDGVASLVHAPGDVTNLFLTEAADLNGDGFEDLMLGGIQACDVVHPPGTFEGLPGCTAIYYGPFEGTFDDDHLGALLVGENPTFQGNPGDTGLDASTDLTGDGVADLVVVDHSLDQRGAFYVVETPLDPIVYMADVPIGVYLDPAHRDDGALVTASGDLDGDGHADLLAATTGQGIFPGTAWVFRGPLSGLLDPADAYVTVEDVNTVGAALPGDMDGDGRAEMVLGHLETQGVYPLEYEMGIYYAPVGVVEPDAVIYGRQNDNGLRGVAAAGDLDGDGLADVAASGHGLLLDGVQAGGVVTILGQNGL